jgi:predicted amidohydrolase
MLRVAAAQIECRPGDVAWNLDLHLAAVAQARERAVDLLVFPELSLTDYLGEPDVARLARASDAPELGRIAAAAGPMAVSLGFVEAADGAACNAQALIAAGRVHVHRKLNLPTYGRLAEGRHYAAGTRLDLVRLRDVRLATLVCADAWNPALPWLAALNGADLLLVPAASALDAVDGFDNPAGWDLVLRHTALAYGLPVVMANHCGTRGGLRFWGGSRVLDAFGKEAARAGADPALIVAEIDPADAAAARARLPTIRDADPALVARELKRFLGESR